MNKKIASSPVKNNNQLKDGDGQVKAHRKQKEAEKSSRRISKTEPKMKVGRSHHNRQKQNENSQLTCQTPQSTKKW